MASGTLYVRNLANTDWVAVVGGASGPQGYQGPTGAPGTPGGPQGDQGYQGPSGSIGTQGTQGYQGYQGYQGNQGYQGRTGTGAQGYQGNTGSQGYQGAQGYQGYQGYQGRTGTGAQGYQGPSGSPGTPGGPQGYQGYQGPSGSPGDPGGPQGYQGATGSQGYQGYQGYQGATISGTFIGARYSSDAGQNIPHNTGIPVNFEDKIYDTDNAVTIGSDWKFVVPYNGYYLVNTFILFGASTAWAVTERVLLQLYKDSSPVNVLDRKDSFSSSSIQAGAQGSAVIYATGSSYLQIFIAQNSGGTLPLSTGTPSQVWVDISKIDVVIGPQGYQGNSGIGVQGYQGATGSQGSQGATGSQGYQGYQGYQGPTGSTIGEQGPQGYQGSPGSGTGGGHIIEDEGTPVTQRANLDFQGQNVWVIDNGLDTTQVIISGGGSTGPQGYQGPTGAQGYQGYQGHTGVGVQGYQGETGAQGSQGYQGATGVGVQGYQGATGAQGFQGYQGYTGVGVQGYQGATGAQGYQGATGVGAQGYQGATGTPGAQGYQGSTGAQGFQGYQGYTGTPGAQGYQGPTGSQGYQGYQGHTGVGAQGYQGATGAQGYQGYQGHTGVGVQGYQGNSGSQGPQGYQGHTGMGIQGATGAQGYQGYQGNTGSPGAQGYQGATGAQGFQGYQGYTGTPGAQGYQGATGTQGAQGYQGTTGAQGYQGYQGHTGTPGAQGYQGSTGSQGPQGYQGATGTSVGGGHTIQDEGVSETQRTNLNFVGALVWVEDDAGNDATKVIISGSSATSGGVTGTAFIGARYYSTSGQSISDGSLTIINFSDKEYDTHTGVTVGSSWKFVAPQDGYYLLDTHIQFSNGTAWIAGDTVTLYSYKDGVVHATLDRITWQSNADVWLDAQGSDAVYLTGSSYVDVRIMAVGYGSALALSTTGSMNYVAISKVDGIQGLQGVEGVQGYQGYQGATGIGVQGYQGYQGYQGETGSQGYQGYTGAQGSQGYQGSTGAQGYQGYQGHTGMGFQGYQGSTGSQGSQGYQGPTGSQGYQGYQGYTGAVGAQGPTGSQGPQGYQGHTGMGFQGYQGSTGALGPQGYQGHTGMGFQGYQGSTGAQGTQGYQGHTGSQGFQGATGATGPQGYQGHTGAQGSQGYQGHTGAQGSQGYQGHTGAQGSQGYQGHTGAQGFQGYQGHTGAQGFQGATGAQGFQGYQGHTGVGAQGYQGPTGSQGFQGYQGYTGTPGAQGYQGSTGSQGAQGYQGVSGGQGPQGYQGYTGTPGAQGYQGVSGGQGPQGYQGTSGVFAALTAGARVYRATNFAVTGSADIYIPFTDVRWDSGGIFNSGSNQTRLTANISGSYLIAGSVRFASDHKGLRHLFVRHNGSTEIDRISIIPVSGASTRLDIATVYSLNATDYVELGVYHNISGTSVKNIETNGNSSPEFAIQLLNGAGPQGFQGYQGYTGSPGSQGYQGATGVGVQGYQGVTGSPGAQGYQGHTGVGAQGYQGATGVGAQGYQGATGSQGFQGYQGYTGAPGPQGYQGYTGTPGAQGYQGSTGAPGPQGYQGYTGTPGAQGYQGATGSPGPQGYQGEGGEDTGVTGTPFYIPRFASDGNSLGNSIVYQSGTADVIVGGNLWVTGSYVYVPYNLGYYFKMSGSMNIAGISYDNTYKYLSSITSFHAYGGIIAASGMYVGNYAGQYVDNCLIADGTIYGKNALVAGYSTGTPTAGDIHASTDIRVGGGMVIGSTTYDPSPTQLYLTSGDVRFLNGTTQGFDWYTGSAGTTQTYFAWGGPPGTGELYTPSAIKSYNSINAGSGLYVGDWTQSPVDNCIHAVGTIYGRTALVAGYATGTPSTGDLHISADARIGQGAVIGSTTFNPAANYLYLVAPTPYIYMGSGTDVNLYRGGADTLQTDDNFYCAGFHNTGDQETHGHIYLYNALKYIFWGDGAGGYDVNLYRVAANYLKTDDTLDIGANLRLVTDGGYIYFGSSADINLYRNAANELKTDDSFTVAGTLKGSDILTLGSFYVYQAGYGINWGDSAGGYDTNLYRSAANVLRTDDSMIIGGGVALVGDYNAGYGTVCFTNGFQGVSSGSGTVKMNGTTSRNSTGWIKIYVDNTARYIPYWDTVTG